MFGFDEPIETPKSPEPLEIKPRNPYEEFLTLEENLRELFDEYFPGEDYPPKDISIKSRKYSEPLEIMPCNDYEEFRTLEENLRELCEDFDQK